MCYVPETMNGGQEKDHLVWLLKHAYHTGCDVRLTDRGDDVVGHRPGPYPAFRWHWKDVLSYQWREDGAQEKGQEYRRVGQALLLHCRLPGLFLRAGQGALLFEAPESSKPTHCEPVHDSLDHQQVELQ